MVLAELRYADVYKQFIWQLELADNSSLEQTLPLIYSYLQSQNLVIDNLKIGINSRVVKNYAVIIKEFDLIEIYQPLIIDPKQIRKLKAKEKSRASKTS